MTGRPPMKGSQAKKPGMRPSMTKTRTVWITEKSSIQFDQAFEKLSAIGEPGQFGKAFRCKRLKNSEILAVKEISKARIYRLHPSDNVRQALLASMQAEIYIMRALKHKYIVNMYETYETKHTLHIVMEECRGGELFDRIKARRRYKERPAATIIRQVCEALFYMHDQHRVVHCDLKPDNILFVTEDEDSDIKIIDFGMSKILPRLKSLRELCGTPYYTAPEIITGDYTHSADMWSVGVICYVMIFGFPPFYVDPGRYYGVEETKQIYKLILKGFKPVIKRGFGAWFPLNLSKKLSKDCLNFIASLMEKVVKDRFTAKEALQHPWLSVGGNDGGGDGGYAGADVDTSLLQNSTPEKIVKSDSNLNITSAKNTASSVSNMDLLGYEFSNFAHAHKFKFAITALFRDTYERMRPQHFQQLKKVFKEMDTDGNGKISYAEFEAGMLQCQDLNLQKHKIQKIFAELDINKVGEIEFSNLLNAAIHDYLIASDSRLYQAFRDLDTKDTGKISTQDLKNKLREMNPYGQIDVLLEIIDEVDLDNDGTIDYEEFLRALHPDFNETPNWFFGNDSTGGSAGETDEQKVDGSFDDTKGDEEYDDDSDMDIADIMGDLDTLLDNEFEDGGLSGSSSNILDMNTNNNSIKAVDICKKGWMRKEGKMVRSWKRRWFVLKKNGVMHYYHTPKDGKAIASFSVKNHTNLKLKSWSKSNKKRYGLKLYTPRRNWKFLCENDGERYDWVTAIEKVSGKAACNESK